jgi:hypothetical protein
VGWSGIISSMRGLGKKCLCNIGEQGARIFLECRHFEEYEVER